MLGLDENEGNAGLSVGTYFRLTLGSRKMIGCVDIGLATLQDMLGPGRRYKDVWIFGRNILMDSWHIRRYRIAGFGWR